MPKQTKRTVTAVLAALIFVMHLALPAVGAAQTGRIAFLPFKANAPQDMSYLTNGIRDMLASRIASEIGLTVIDKTVVDKALAGAGTPNQTEAFLKLAKTLQADFLVVGSLTAMGSSLSLDAKVFEVAKGAPRNFYATAKNESEIIQSIDSLAWDISEKVFAHKRPASALAQPQAAAQSGAQAQPQYATAHPDRAFAGRTGMGGGSPFIYPKGITSEFQKTQNMKLSLQFMEMADLDGDGQDEVIFADNDSVQIFKRDSNRLSKVGQIRGKVGYRIHAITVADLNKNGKPEIYVSAADNKQPNSFAFEWLGADKANYIFENARWYVRAMSVPGEGLVLAGQRADSDKAVAPGIFRLDLANGALKAGSSMEVPASVNLFEFTIADLDNDGSREIVAIDQYDRLQVLRAGGTVLWKSDEFYGGTTRFIGGTEGFGAGKASSQEGSERIYIPSRIIVYDVNGDGQMDVIINKNLSTSSRLFENMKNYPSGEIHALSWNGIALSELWRTRKIDGYIVDYLLRPNADKKGAELLVGLILGSSSMDLFAEQTSTMLIYQLDFTKKTEQ
ncbi:MAG: FG-GAP-like repeat-containing protein [Desulfobulbia bacterium]